MSNCPKCNYPKNRSSGFIGLYSSKEPCPQCKFFDYDGKNELLINDFLEKSKQLLNDLVINLKRDKVNEIESTDIDDYNKKLRQLVSQVSAQLEYNIFDE